MAKNIKNAMIKSLKDDLYWANKEIDTTRSALDSHSSRYNNLYDLVIKMTSACEDELFEERKDQENSFEAGVLKGREEMAKSIRSLAPEDLNDLEEYDL